MSKKNKLYKMISTLSLACLMGVGLAHGQDVGDVLIRNGTVLTVTNGVLKNTDLLIMKGKIAQLGKSIKAPKGVQVIDATDRYVMPGIVDAHSHIALDGINEATNQVTAEVWQGDALNPLQIEIYRALAGGCTISHAMHGSANAIGGQCQTVKHRYGVFEPEKIIMKGAPRTIKFALGENPTGQGRRHNLFPQTRMGIEFVIRQAFSEAKQYRLIWKRYNANKNTRGFMSPPPAYSLRLETLADILEGKIIVHCHSYRADEINMLLNVCKDFGIKRIVFQHVNEGFKVAPELANYGAMASVFADWWDYKFEVYYSTAYNAAILTRNGVVTSINSDSPDLIRHLYHEAAKTQKYGGLNDEEALALITINPAKQLGIESRVGSIELGKEGDVVVFENHPLSIYAIPTHTIVDGIVRFDREKDPADMRLLPDPEMKDDAVFYDRYEGSRNHCMEGADFLSNDLSEK